MQFSPSFPLLFIRKSSSGRRRNVREHTTIPCGGSFFPTRSMTCSARLPVRWLEDSSRDDAAHRGEDRWGEQSRFGFETVGPSLVTCAPMAAVTRSLRRPVHDNGRVGEPVCDFECAEGTSYRCHRIWNIVVNITIYIIIIRSHLASYRLASQCYF